MFPVSPIGIANPQNCTANVQQIFKYAKKLQNAEFVKTSELSKQRKDNIVKFYYFKDESEELYYNVAEEMKGKGRIFKFLYSITRKIK